MFMLFGINLSLPLVWILAVAGAGGLAAWSRRIWTGGVLMAGLSLVLYHPTMIIRFPVIFLAFVLVGLAAGATGWALRHRRLRMAALSALWAGAGLALFYLYTLAHQVHSTADLVFAGGLLVTLLVLGALTVISLPPGQVTDKSGGA